MLRAMIVVVTLDPAVHVSYETKRIVPGQSHPVGRVTYRAGGRGPAVARMLHTFGHEVVAAGLTGGTAGELIKAELSRRGRADPVHADRHGVAPGRRGDRRVDRHHDQLRGAVARTSRPRNWAVWPPTTAR